MQQSNSRVEQVSELVRSLIDEQAFDDGRLPSEPELTRLVGASRATVRQALSKLESEGIITRKHGVGTFVNEHVMNIGTRLDQVWDFDEMIQVAGYEPGVQHEALSLEPATPEIAAKLALSTGDEVVITANIFLADDTPVIYCIDVIPAHLVIQAYREEELHGPVYQFLQQRCNQRVDYNITRFLPVLADRQMAGRLYCEAGAPLHYFEEIGYNTADVPIIYSEEYYRPEFFDFKIVRKMTTRRSR